MSKLKKLTALTLALAMLLSLTAFAGSYKDNTYADAQQIDKACAGSVEMMYALDIMKGDEKGNFNPNATITRAEVAKMIYVILNKGKDDKAVNYVGGNLFSDVPAGAWYEGYVNYCGMRNLIQGTGDGKFAPNAPVTVPAVAKMLLTAIGYSAKDRSYVGANWANNVLADAAVIGLLENFNYSTTAAAPRQWVAVLFENALLNAYTYANMAPVVSNGLITGVVVDKDKEAYLTMGEKYYGLEDFTAVAVATENVSLDGSKTAKNGVLFDNKADLKNTGLGFLDLGQEYRVIHNGSTIYSIRRTGVSKTAESLLRDVEGKVVTGTSDNWANNRYEFTIGKMVAKLDKNASIVTIGTQSKNEFKGEKLDAKEFYNQALKGADLPHMLRAIDADGDGDIDYTMLLAYDYAVVASAGTSRAYGDYVMLKNQKDQYIEARNGTKWYIEDVISTEDKLEKGNYVKFLYNPDKQMWDFEVLPVIEEEFERLSSGQKFTIGGEVYVWSELNFGDEEALYRKHLGEDVIIAADGDMIVAAKSPKDVKNDLEGINDQLVVVLDKSDHYYQDWDKDYAVKYLDINNKVSTAVWLTDSKAEYEALNTVRGWNEGKIHAEEGKPAFMLYILSANDKGEITSLVPAMTDFKKLDAEEGFFPEYKDIPGWKVGDKNKKDFVEVENTFFVGMLEKDELVVEAMPLSELGEVTTGKNARYEGIFEMSGNKVNTLVSGYLFADKLTGATESNYLYVTDVWNDKDHKDTVMANVIMPDNSEAEVELTNARKDVEVNELYAYEYNKYKDIYTLKPVKMSDSDITGLKFDAKNPIVEDKDSDSRELVLGKGNELFYGDQIFVKDGKGVDTLDLSKADTFAVKKYEITRDRTDDRWDVDSALENVELEFVTLKELKGMSDMLINGNTVDGDTYYTDFHYAEDDILYIVSYRVVDMAQDMN